MKNKLAGLIFGTICVAALAGCTGLGTGSLDGSMDDFYVSYSGSISSVEAHVEGAKFSLPMSIICDWDKKGTIAKDSFKAQGQDYLISEITVSGGLFYTDGKEHTAGAIQRVLGDSYCVDADAGRMVKDTDGVCKAIFPLAYNGYSGYLAYITKGEDDGYLLAAVRTDDSEILPLYECENIVLSFAMCDCTDYTCSNPTLLYPEDSASFYEDYTGADADEEAGGFEDEGNLDYYYEEGNFTGVGTKTAGTGYIGYIDIPDDFILDEEDLGNQIVQYVCDDKASVIGMVKYDESLDIEGYANSLVDEHLNTYNEEAGETYAIKFLGYDAMFTYLYYGVNEYYDTTAVMISVVFNDENGGSHILWVEAPTDDEAYNLFDYLYTYRQK